MKTRNHRGCPLGWAGQGFHQPEAVPPPVRSRAAGGNRGSPSPRHHGWTKVGLGCGPMCGPRLMGTMAGQSFGEVETGPVITSLGQWPVDLGGCSDVLGHGKGRGRLQGELDWDNHGCWWPQNPNSIVLWSTVTADSCLIDCRNGISSAEYWRRIWIFSQLKHFYFSSKTDVCEWLWQVSVTL